MSLNIICYPVSTALEQQQLDFSMETHARYTLKFEVYMRNDFCLMLDFVVVVVIHYFFFIHPSDCLHIYFDAVIAYTILTMVFHMEFNCKYG